MDEVDSYTGNGLTLDSAPFGLEKIYDYEPGGHHPVHLGDNLGYNGDIASFTSLGAADLAMSGFVGIWIMNSPSTWR